MLEIRDVAREFTGGAKVLERIDLSIGQGEIVAVVGASGCGKSTLLRLIAGLDTPTRGEIRVHGHKLEGPDREIGVVFQEPRLMPWLDLVDNVAFGLREGSREERRAAARKALQRVGLGHALTALPRELSGGMAQRAAIARALVTRPPVLLLDEPFSALDVLTREALQDELLGIWADDRPTLVLVTHDLDEALVLGDRVVVLGGRPGHVRADVVVGLPRPRRRTGAEFQALKAELVQLLTDGQTSPRIAA